MSGDRTNPAPTPLEGVAVVDLSRMLPGVILDRLLLDLGATVIKVEDPSGGDPMRAVPPFLEGTGAGFALLMRGARSVAVDLRSDEGREALRRLLGNADVLVESFRPGTLEAWDLPIAGLRAAFPRLVVVSLTGFASASRDASLPVHDLNLAGLTGALDLLGSGSAIQLADIAAALLAAAAIPAALFRRERTGLGTYVEQPLATGPMPFTAWAACERAVGGESLAETLLTGRAPCYRRYTCGDGRDVAVAALEPKYWLGVLALLGLPDLAAVGFNTGSEGQAASERIAAVFATAPRPHWLGAAREATLPITAVHHLDGLAEETPPEELRGQLERIALPDGRNVHVPGAFIPSLSVATRADRAPALGEHNRDLLGPSPPGRANPES